VLVLLAGLCVLVDDVLAELLHLHAQKQKQEQQQQDQKQEQSQDQEHKPPAWPT